MDSESHGQSPDPYDETKCDSCGERTETVRQRKLITIGTNSGTVRAKFCDECAARLQSELPRQPAIDELMQTAQHFSRRAQQMVREWNFAGARDQFDLSARATIAAQRAEAAHRGDEDDIAMPEFSINGTPATIKMLNDLGYEVRRNAEGKVAGVGFPESADDKVMGAYALERWINGGPPPPAKPPALVEHGNLDLTRYPVAKVKRDGTFDRILVLPVKHEDTVVVIPTVTPQGKELTDEQAYQYYLDTGQHLGVFADFDSAWGFVGGIVDVEKTWIERTRESVLNRHVSQSTVTGRQPATASRSRKRWMIGLSIVALYLAYSIANRYVEHYKWFATPDRVATANIVEVDPGEPPHDGTRDEDGDSGDAGVPASSHYQFTVNGKVYDGWVSGELSVGKSLLVRYNSSDPNINHAQDDHTTFLHEEKYVLILLLFVLALLAWFIRRGNLSADD